MLPPEVKQSSFPLMKGQDAMLPGHSSLSDGKYLHLMLEKSTEKPNLSESTLALSKSEPAPQR